jgi:hypothetical protein
LKRIQQECPLKLHRAPLANRLDLLKLPIRQRTGIMQQTSDECRFSMIYMADNDDTEGVSTWIRIWGSHM